MHCPPHQHHGHDLDRRDEQLRGRHGQAPEVALAERAPHIRPAQAVGRARHEGHAKPDGVGPADRLPRLEDDQDSDEPGQHRRELAPRQSLGGQQRQREEHRRQGGRGVADAGERGRHPLLARGEQREGQRAQEEARHHQVAPHPAVAREGAAGEGQQDQERTHTGEDPQPGDLERGQRAQTDLHEQEARAPDARQQQELRLPRHTARPDRRDLESGGCGGCHGLVNSLRVRTIPWPPRRPTVERPGPPLV